MPVFPDNAFRPGALVLMNSGIVSVRADRSSRGACQAAKLAAKTRGRRIPGRRQRPPGIAVCVHLA